MTYEEWSHHHAVLFGFASQVEIDALKAWRELFKKQGYTPEELTIASDWLILHRSTSYKMEHPTMIVENIKDQRHYEIQRQDQARWAREAEEAKKRPRPTKTLRQMMAEADAKRAKEEKESAEGNGR